MCQLKFLLDIKLKVAKTQDFAFITVFRISKNVKSLENFLSRWNTWI